MDDDIPVVVRMRVECARCGHTEDDTYEFDVPIAKARPMEAYEPGKCPVCRQRMPVEAQPEAMAEAEERGLVSGSREKKESTAFCAR